jgi:TonB family protein
VKGKRIDNTYYPIASGSSQGREEYKYDQKGNVIDLTVRGKSGSVLSHQIFKYEFDDAGNWIKVTAAVEVFQQGKLSFQPAEVTYRTITYYPDSNMAKLAGRSKPSSPQKELTAGEIVRHDDATPSARARGGTGHSVPLKGALPPGSSTPPRAADHGLSTAAVNPTPSGATRDKKDSESGGAKIHSESPGTSGQRPVSRRVDSGSFGRSLLNFPLPEYPEEAKRARVSGTVNVEVVIDGTGKVIGARVLDGPGVLQEAAVQAARQAAFSRKFVSGKPVESTAIITYKFTTTP